VFLGNGYVTDMKALQLTGLLEREGNEYVSLCPELDVASQGSTVEEALANLREAVELFLESASPEEIESRYHSEVIVSRFEASYA
jgi:predicted RNase H-like HicB family nuclease